MSSIVISSLQWSRFRDIDDVEPVGESDCDCLGEVRDVLKRHGKLDRFGVALLHSHFDLSPGEVWIEESDPDSRTLITKPCGEDEARQNSVGTIWHLREDGIETSSWCRKYCSRWFLGHDKAHNHES